MHQKGSLVSPSLSGVFCQCSSAEAHRGVDPGGGEHAQDPTPAQPSSTPQSSVSDQDPDLCRSSSHPCELCGDPEQDRRLKVLFHVLDVNGDGGICVNDLTIGLKKLGVHRTEHELMVSVSVISMDHVGGGDCELSPPTKIAERIRRGLWQEWLHDSQVHSLF